ncbi:hypothetical protein F3Y22_tig00112530pilonHSYRG00122 [Hibiscus syriacus]|uniref:Uncharacterized protein n=1 Tax=Hibiscus syriacus TaxID=106335 RepID=A0A6A2WW70_HIBSY|nr:hypothetical protein F3Y22_tig00112530pilonHSYRG00122 [Hibiscus syriacus]
MELKVPSPTLGGSSPDCFSDPEEKEVSDEDDRNHKHRKRDRHPQSLERDSIDPLFTGPYRKHKKPFENGHPFRENESQAGEAWKNCNGLPPENNFTPKFDRRHPRFASIPRGNLDQNERIRSNQTFSGDFGPGSVAPSFFTGRGLSNVSSAQSPSWSVFGLMPGMPNVSLDALHPLGLQRVLGPPTNSSLKRGIPLPRCKNFEERGFCLRGDMCPMEHDVNRIIVEDVQSLSQFNIPVAVPTVKLLPTPGGRGALPAGVSPTNLMNRKGLHNKNCKPVTTEDALGMNGTGSTNISGADLYDPDQPLWNNNVIGKRWGRWRQQVEFLGFLLGVGNKVNDKDNDGEDGFVENRWLSVLSSPPSRNEKYHNGLEASAALSGLHSPEIDGTESLLNEDISDYHRGSLYDAVMSRTGRSRTRINTKDKICLTSLDCLENETKEEQAYPSSQGTSSQVKQIGVVDDGSKVMDSSMKSQTDCLHKSRKSTTKAQCTLFINGIPQKSNKREALLSHFLKFGTIIDIHIPLNSERAIVQFSRREKTEAGLKGPDAPAANRGKDNLTPVLQKRNVIHGVDVPSLNSSKPHSMNGPMVPTPPWKKLETLEQMKEELRNLVGSKTILTKLPRGKSVGIAVDPAKASTPRSSEPGASAATPCSTGMTDKGMSTENVLSPSPKSKLQSRLSAPVAHPFPTSKYKLDNRPTASRVISPLPSDFAHVDVLKEHFSQYGDLISVEMEDMENDDDGIVSETLKNCSARITYSTRLSAERAFVNEISSSTPKEPLEADEDQTEENFACSFSQEVASYSRESENSDVKSFAEHTDLAEGSENSPSLTSSAKVSPKSKESVR